MRNKRTILFLSLCLFVLLSLFAISDTIIFNENSPTNNREKVIIGIQILKVVKENGKPLAIVENNQENVKKLNEAGVKFLPDKQNPNLLLKAYDPTNGATNGGDIFRVKQ